VTTSVLTGAVVFTPILTVIAQGETLNRPGPTFPAPLYELYASEVKQKYPDLKVNY
jgi:phosphate transport system substrate-binding protein